MSKVKNLAKGIRAEQIASSHLTKLGYQVLERNYSTRFGEIDIIAHHGDTLVFIEVKYRCNPNFGLPIEAVTSKKLSKIKLAINEYIQHKPTLGPLRIDVVSLMGDLDSPQIEHIQNVSLS